MKSMVQSSGPSTAKMASGVTAIGRVVFLFLVVLTISLSTGSLALAQGEADADQPATAAVKDAVEEGAEEGAAALTASGAAAVTPEAESALPGFILLAIIIALFVIPIYLGGVLSRSLHMPEHSWKFALAIGTLAAAAVVVGQGEIKYGPDLSGGHTLIFELQDINSELSEEDLEDDGSGSSFEERTTQAKRELVRKLIAALIKRVDPSGIKEVTIREYGLGQIEIIIPKASEQELEVIERQIYTAGALEFRITASPEFNADRAIIDAALAMPLGENVLVVEGEKVAKWVSYRIEEFGPVDEPSNRVVKRQAGLIAQALVKTDDGQNIVGGHLKQTVMTIGDSGKPEVSFKLDTVGAYRFGLLTGTNLPNSSGARRSLGIVLDDRLISAPSINTRITRQGVIEGIPTEEEVKFLIDILDAGSLPAALNKDPISRETISPTLGAQTVVKATTAIAVSLAAVMVFMLFYYRKAGFIACLALGANLLLILGLMVLVHAAFTLPGLAGLVLTIGMSVDANVLIFERIREERNRGSALRMAIRNGFGRATRTIVDANVTTLITAIVIYKIAPDNVKGFGVTLIFGILMSMYAAIFLSRIIFDVGEKIGSIKELKMRQVISKTSIDFLGKRPMAVVFSLVVIVIGLAAVFDRGGDLLNIDFTGGSSVTMVFEKGQEMKYDDVKKIIVEQTDLADKNLSLVEVGEHGSGVQYTVSSVEQDINAVQEVLHKIFGKKLKTYKVEASEVTALPSESAFIRPPARSALQLVSFQEEAEESADEATDSAESEATPEESAAEESVPEETKSETEPAETEPAETEPAETEATETEATETDATPADTTEASAPTEEATESEATESETSSDRFAGGSSFDLNFDTDSEKAGDGDDEAGISYDAVKQLLTDALEATGHGSAALSITNSEYQVGSVRRFKTWNVKLALPVDQANQVAESIKTTASSKPIFPMASKIGGRVAGDMTSKAIAAILISLLGIIAYIWIRFQHVMYGLAAVIALVHDVLITLGMIAISAWVVNSIPVLADMLMIDKFQISLPIVAAFLTIIGYSLNDTIVVFDRIREVKGKSPNLTADTINNSINQTLSRTLLTSVTTLLSVVLLYFLGGDGIHGFAFALVVGVIVGTYSSIFIASPALYIMSQRAAKAIQKPGAKAA